MVVLFSGNILSGNDDCVCPGETPYAGVDGCGNHVCDADRVGVIDAENGVDCWGDGVLYECSAAECPECSEANPDPKDGEKCCGIISYDPETAACCPFGESVVAHDVSEDHVDEWCKDCEWIDQWEMETGRFCCSDHHGTRMVKKTIACECFSCVMGDCVDTDWADFFWSFVIYGPDGKLKGKKGVALDLVEVAISVITEGLNCRDKVCPGDFPCA